MKIGLVSIVGLAIWGLLVSGCGKAPPRALYTVNYYRTHEDFRNQKLEECRGDPARLREDPDCVNATEADREEN